MRKTALLLVICLSLALFCGCNTASDAKLFTTQGDAAMEAGQYETALTYYNQAKDTGSATNKVIALCEILSAYLEASEAYEKEDFHKADDIIEHLEYDYNGYSPIEDDMQELIKKIDLATKSTKRIDRALGELASAIGESDYDTAYELINELDGYTLNDDQREEFAYQLERMQRKQGTDEKTEEAPEEKEPAEEQPEETSSESGDETVPPAEQEEKPAEKPAAKPAEKPSANPPETYEGTDGWYRIRKSWDDPSSQIHALKTLENAKKAVNENPGYKAYDNNGNVVYP